MRKNQQFKSLAGAMFYVKLRGYTIATRDESVVLAREF